MLVCYDVDNSNNNYQKKQAFPPKLQDKTEKIINYFRKTTNTKRRVWNEILKIANFSYEIHPSQTTISRGAGITRSYANRLLHEISEESGLMEIVNRGYKVSCVYKITKWFFEIDIRSQLSEFFSAMKYIPIFGLLSLGNDGIFRKIKKFPFEYDTQLVKNNNKFIYKQHSQSTICKSDYKLSTKNVVSYEKNMESGNSRHVCNVRISTSIIKDIKLNYMFNLSKSGALKLICYPSKVLLLAIEDLKFANRKNIKNIYAWFKDRCNQHLKSNNLQCDYKLMYQMSEKHNVDLKQLSLIENQHTPKSLAPEKGRIIQIPKLTAISLQELRTRKYEQYLKNKDKPLSFSFEYFRKNIPQHIKDNDIN